MRKISTRALALSLSTAMLFSMAACGKDEENPDATPTPDTQGTTGEPGVTNTPDDSNTPDEGEPGTPEPTQGAEPIADYIYKDYVSLLPAYWNPLDYQTLDDSYMSGWIDMGLYNFVYNDEIHPVEGREPYQGYKIIPEMAASDPVDVTEQIKASHPQFQIPESATSGYAYTIDLNQNACWEDGTPINADTYVYSMKQLLDPKMLNYRAADYFTGSKSIAGAEEYFYGGRTTKVANSTDAETVKYEIADLVKGDDGVYKTADGKNVYIDIDEGYAWLGGTSLKALYAQGGYIQDEGCWDILEPQADKEGLVPVTEENLNALFAFTGTTTDSWGAETWEQLAFYLSVDDEFHPEIEYDGNVGLFKSGDYQITIVFDKALSGFQLYYSLTSNWLVYEPYYEACKKETNGTFTTNYNTGVETTMSYGPYKLTSYQTDKALRLEKNEKWYGYTDELHKYQDPTDGQVYRMYMTEVIDTQVINEPATQKQMFLKGELASYGLGSEDFDAYRNSEFVHVTPAATLYFFIFNGFLDAINQRESAADFDTAKYDLQTMTLQSFRKAIAVTYDKELLCASISPARSGGYGLIGTSYIYDPDTGARYRDTDQAKQVLCDFYSVDVSKYASLDDAVASITGYDPVAAKELYNQAFKEAIEKGYITDADGDGKSDQVVRIEYCVSAASSFITKTVDYLNEKLAEVLAGTPFEGKIEFFESAPYGTTWSDKIKSGLSDVVLAGWTGSTLDPFGLTELYTDPGRQYDGKWFDATKADLTLTVDIAPLGQTPDMQTITMNLKQWSDALNGATVESPVGPVNFGDGMAEVDTRLTILAGVEGKVLQTYDYIPMLQDAGMSLLSQQLYYVVEEYSPIMSRGGIAYLKYNYTEKEWREFVAANGGELSY